MPTLHVLGAGRTARTLARLGREAGVWSVGQVCNRRPERARAAVDWIGEGTATERFEALERGDWLMIGVPDSAIADCVADVVARGPSDRPGLAFHLSGAEPAERIEGLAEAVASVHPVCAFADPDRALSAFPGSFAVGEGDPAALDRLLPAFEAIGARTLRFRPTNKRLYHASMIAASNFLCTLDALALDLAEAGGLTAEQALPLIVTLQSGALGTIAERGPVDALTGPIERGDSATCATLVEQVRAHAAKDEAFRFRVEPLLMALGRATVGLARRKHGEDPAGGPGLDAIGTVFEEVRD
ncbi:DUF2520 domain-containing protein [Halomonas denitrificans]|nr:DUF2520 domain-containing protein [Halomonas denitrificans]